MTVQVHMGVNRKWPFGPLLVMLLASETLAFCSAAPSWPIGPRIRPRLSEFRGRVTPLQLSAEASAPSVAICGDDGLCIVPPEQTFDALPPVPPLLKGRSSSAAIWSVAWPSVVIGLLRTANGQVDAWYIGRLGAAQLEAISAAAFAVWMIYTVGELSAVGVHALSSAAEGAGNRQEGVGAAIVQGMWFAIASSAVLAVLALRPKLLAAYFSAVGVRDPAVAAMGAAYTRVTALGALPLSAAACASAGFKGIGETRPALLIAAATVLCNVALNGPFIARYGVAGAAWATTIAASLGCIISLGELARRGVRLRLRPPRLRSLARIGVIGAPLACSGLLFSGVYMGLGRTLSALSPSYLAALGIGHRIEAVAYTACEGYAVGCATVVGQWAGAKRLAEARTAATSAARTASLMLLPLAAVTWMLAERAAAVFAQDPLVISAAGSYLRTVALCFPLMAVEAVYEGALTGMQRTLWVLAVGIVFNLGRIPLALWLVPRWGVEGVWMAIAISTGFKAPIKWLCFRLARPKVEML